MSAERRMRVVLCDDALEMRQLLRWTLESVEELAVVGEAEHGDEAIALLRELRPHVAVLDLQMPGPEPDALLQELAAVAPETAIVTYSGFDLDLVAADAAHLVARHVPKTADIAIVRQTIVEVALTRRHAEDG